MSAPMSAPAPQAHPAPPADVGIGRSAQVLTGLALLVPATVALLWSYVVPSFSTLIDSFGAEELGPNRRRASDSGGLDAYQELFAAGFDESLRFALVLALAPLLLALLVAPLLALAAERSGRVPRLVTRALLALPLAAYAPLAVGTARAMEQLPPFERGVLPVARTATLLSAGLVIAVSATVFLAVLRRRPGGRPWTAALAVGGVLGLTVVAVALQTWSLQFPVIRALVPTRLPMADIYQQAFVLGLLGGGAAGSVVLLVLLGMLGLLAVVLLVLTRTRIAFTGWRDRPAAPAPAVRNPVALGALVVGLVALLGVLGYVLTPWLRLLTTEASPLPSGVSTAQVQVNTWLPPLISAVVGVGVAALAGFAIGGLRPLGRASELLLLPFAPWLFVGVGPLALSHFLRAREADQLDTFVGLIPPSWLSIPALVVFTLFFRGQRERWEAGGGFASAMLLPALPMLAGAVLLSWLVTAQGSLWPRLAVQDAERQPAANFVLERLARSSADQEVTRGDLAQLLPLPMLLFFLVAFLMLQLLYLDRLVIVAGRQQPEQASGVKLDASGAPPEAVVRTVPRTVEERGAERS